VPSDRPRQLWLLPVLLITVIATAVGGLLARDLYADEGPSAPAAVIPSQTSMPPSEQPGPKTVSGTPDATQHPLYGNVRDLLQLYFDSINAKDYAGWQRTVTERRLENQPKDKWLHDYRTTRDGSAVIYRIELAGDDTARVLLTFVSVQDEADAPAELPARCIQWSVVLPLVRQSDGWRIDRTSASSSPQHERCDT
jgi:hypothetical protein